MNQKQTNRKKSFKRIMKMVVSYYPVLFPLIVLLIIINAVLGALPSIFQQNVIAVLQQAWEQGWTWEVTKPYIVKLVGTLALVYLIALIIGIVYTQLMAFFTQAFYTRYVKKYLHICRNCLFVILIHIRTVTSCLTIQTISMQCVR